MSTLKIGDRVFLPSMGTAYRTGGPGGLLNFNPGGWSNPVVNGTLFTLAHADGVTMTFHREDDWAIQSGPINPTRKLLKMGAKSR